MVETSTKEKRSHRGNRVEYRHFGDGCIQPACKSAQNQPRIAHVSFCAKPSFKDESLPPIPH